jgi:hypothetical protein
MHYHSTVDIYDVSTNTWSVTNMSEAKYGVAAAVAVNKVFFAGGVGTNQIGNTTYFAHHKNKVEVYDITTNTWSVSTLSEAKTDISAVTLNNKIYFAGGTLEGIHTFSSRIDIYDNASSTWSTSSLSEPKHVLGIATANKIYYGGGLNGQTLCKVEIKDFDTQTTTLDNLYQPAASRPFLKNNKIIFYKNLN